MELFNKITPTQFFLLGDWDAVHFTRTAEVAICQLGALCGWCRRLDECQPAAAESTEDATDLAGLT